MYFAQEFVPLEAAIIGSAFIVLAIIAVRAATIMGIRLAISGAVLPALAIFAVTLVSAVHPRLQGVLIALTALAAFVAAMALIPPRITRAVFRSVTSSNTFLLLARTSFSVLLSQER